MNIQISLKQKIYLLSALEGAALAWFLKEPITGFVLSGKSFSGRSVLFQLVIYTTIFCVSSLVCYAINFILDKKQKNIEEVFYRLKRYSLHENATLLFLGIIGIILRIRQYTFARSLWFDELSLAHNFLKYDTFFLLSNPLDSRQSAPLGFVVITDLVGSILNNSDKSLRLLPFVFGMGVVILSIIAAKKFLPPRARYIFIWLVSLSPSLIYYSNELKPYIADVFFYLIILVNFHLFFKKKNRIFYIVTIGCFAILFSFPSVIFLFVFGVVLFIDAIVKHKKKDALLLIFSSSIWLLLFSVIFLGYTRRYSPMEYFNEFWSNKFAPLSLSSLKWYWDTLLEFSFLGFHPYKPIRIHINPNQFEINNLIIVGLIILGMFIQTKKNTKLAIFNWGIIVITLLLSAFKLYPFGSRMGLYFIPIAFSFLSIFISDLLLHPAFPIKFFGFQVAIFSLVLITIPSINNFFNPIDNADIKRPLQYLHDNSVSTDVLTMIDDTYPAFSFYSKNYNLPNYSKVMAFHKPFDVTEYNKILCSTVKTEKVWILITQMFDEGKEFVSELSNKGKLLDYWESSGSGLYYIQFDLEKLCQQK